MTMGNKNAFFLIFDIYYVALNVVTYVMSYTVYASQVKFLLRLELMKAYINVNFKFHCILFSTSLNKAGLILATSSKLLFESNYLKAITERFSFQIYLCQTQAKLLALFSYTTFD